MRIGQKRSAAQVDEENPNWMSFSDIMSGLLVIFILASVILILQLMEKQREFDREIEQLKKAEEVRRSILTEAAEELQKRGIEVELNENETVLRIPNRILGFDSGADEIDPQYQDTAFEIGSVIQSLIALDDRVDYLDTVFVEGHTDSRAFYDQQCGDKGNWCLSSFRAISLWLFWESALPETNRLSLIRNQQGDPLFSVSGYADTRRVIENEENDLDYQQNRRIDIRFTIRRPNSEEYERISSQFSTGL